MKGAIGKAMQGTADPAVEDKVNQRHPEQPEDPQQQGGEQATPEEQDAYERAVLAGMQLIFDDDSTNEAVLKMLKSQADDPAQAIAQTTAMLIQVLEEKSNNELPETIIVDLADELAGNLMALGEKEKIFKTDENTLGRAAQHIGLLLDQMYPSAPEDAEQMMSGMSEDDLAKIHDEQSRYSAEEGA